MTDGLSNQIPASGQLPSLRARHYPSTPPCPSLALQMCPELRSHDLKDHTTRQIPRTNECQPQPLAKAAGINRYRYVTLSRQPFYAVRQDWHASALFDLHRQISSWATDGPVGCDTFDWQLGPVTGCSECIAASQSTGAPTCHVTSQTLQRILLPLSAYTGEQLHCLSVFSLRHYSGRSALRSFSPNWR